MRPRYLVIITLLALCHLHVGGQTLTNALPPAVSAPAAPHDDTDQTSVASEGSISSESSISIDANGSGPSPSALPDDPDQEILPVAQPQPAPATGNPVEFQAQNQQWLGDTVTLTGDVVFYYRNYVLHADKVIYNRKTTELEADGHLQVAGGPNDILINASNGEMRLDIHTARFYNVHGSQGVRRTGHTVVYSTPNPLLFTARVVIEQGEGRYKLIDGSMTNCRIPHPDWQIIAHTIALDQQRASTSSAWFKFLSVPIFYLPYLGHAVAANDRESGFLIPALGNSSLKGYVVGEQVYWAINRSMDLEAGTEYFSKRGWAPLGDFRYKGPGVDHLTARWDALFDRGIEEPTSTGGEQRVNQGGVDILAQGIKAFSPETRVAGTAEYLSSYVYRLIFNDNYSQATSSQVSSDVALTHAHNGFVPSIAFDRFQTFASTTNGDEVRILHLPNLRYDVVNQPLGAAPLYWSMGSSLDYLSRSEPDFHARNVGRFDFYPRLTLPLKAGGWNFVAQGALRDTAYSDSEIPSTTHFIPTISHTPLNRVAAEASLDIRPPVVEHDFELPFGHSVLRHVIEPELTYRYVGGIGPQARNVLLFDTTDIVTNTNQFGYSLTQRFYVRSRNPRPCATDSDSGPAAPSPDSNTAADPLPGPDADSTAATAPVNTTQCPAPSREWASWQLAQDFYIEPAFGGAVVSGHRNVFESTLDLTGVAFLTAPRNISPLISRMRLNAVPNMRVEWDFDYDPIAGRMNADNLFAGYSFGRTTLGVVHALLNAVDENTSTTGTNFVLGTLTSQELQPFLEFGKPSGKGANVAVNAGYDFAEHTLQYAGVEGEYNWDCCGLSLGYRNYELGTVGTASANYHEWLYSFTLADFANVGNIRRANSIFHDPLLPPVY